MKGAANSVSWHTHEEDYTLARISGTTRQGEVVVGYRTLVARFGLPTRNRHCNADWAVSFIDTDGEVVFATISDEQKLISPERVTHWQISGFGSDAAMVVHKALWDVIGIPHVEAA